MLKAFYQSIIRVNSKFNGKEKKSGDEGRKIETGFEKEVRHE